MADVANLVVQIAASSAKLDTDLATAKGKIEAFASSAIGSMKTIAAIGFAAAAAGAGLLIHEIDATADKMEELITQSERFGLTTEQFQRLKFQAEQANVSVESLSNGLRFMEKNIEQAATGTGSKQLKEAFASLGLSAEILKTESPQQQFMDIARAMSQVSSQGTKMADAIAIFGRGGAQIIPMLTDELEKSGAEFDKLGIGISKEQSNAVKEFEKSAKELGAIWEGFKMQVVSDVLPAFTDIIKHINGTVTGFGGLRLAALQTAKTIVEAVSLMLKPLIQLHDIISEVGSGISAVNAVGGSIGHFVYNQFHTPTGEFTSTYQGSAAQSVWGNNNKEFAPDAAKLTSAIDDFNKTSSTFGQSSVLTKLDEEIAKLTASIQASAKPNTDNALGKLAGKDTGTNGGFGYIQSMQTGQLLVTGKMPKQEVDVNVDLQLKGNLSDLIDAKIDKKINDASRGSAR